MKPANKAIAVTLLLLSSAIFLHAQETKVKFSGNFLTDQRLMVQDDFQWAWNENRLDLSLDARYGGKVKFYSNVWLRNLGLPKISSAYELYNKNIVQPYNLFIREAYVEFYGLFTKNLDVKIGKQRIAWGTGDRLNPTDNLNPADFEDVMDFGRHNGSVALNMTYYFKNNSSVQGVYIPFFEPATTPVGVYVVAFAPTFNVPPPFYLNQLSDSLVMPAFNFSQGATSGLKYKGFAAGYDFSFSYVWGYNGLPVPLHNNLSFANETGGLNIQSTEGFFRQHIFGADLAGSIGSVGVWAEAAAFLPEIGITMTNNLSGIPVSEMDSVILKKEVFVKYLVGFDYTFRDGSYLNFQYLHGFVNEYGRGNLNDYFMIDYEKRFFDDKLKINPITGAFIVSDWKNVANNYAITWVPSIAYRPVLNAEIQLGVYVFAGKGENMFVNLVDYDMIFFKVSFSF